MPWGQMKSSMLKLFWLLTTSSPEIRRSTRSIYASVKPDDHKQNRGVRPGQISATLNILLIVEGLLYFDNTKGDQPVSLNTYCLMWKTARRESARSNQ